MADSSVLTKTSRSLTVSIPLFCTAPDTTAPTISCLQPTVTQSAPCGGTASVSFIQPTGQDNCGTVNVACTGVSPTGTPITITVINNLEQGTFPVGTSAVTCTATDGAGLTATCPISVVVTAGMLHSCFKLQSNFYENDWGRGRGTRI